MEYENFSIKNYKCFQNQTIIKSIKQINIIIGRNNIGKSSLIDAIEYLNGFKEGFENSEVIETLTVTEDNLQNGFSKNIYYPYDYTHSLYDRAIQYCGRKVLRKIEYSQSNSLIKQKYELVDYERTIDNDFINSNKNNWDDYVKKSKRNNKIVKRIFGERDIKSEVQENNNIINGNGVGSTNILRRYLYLNELDEKIVKKDILNKLNEIMGSDVHFEEINVQIINEEKNEWEIYLKENSKPRVALSKSGSGLKTILLILIYTLLIPKMENRLLCDYIFAFEEIENNLHHSLLRRTLKYIEEVSNEGAQFYLTTHSNIMLDSFQNTNDVSFYNVTKDEKSSKVEYLGNIVGKKELFR